MDDLAAQDKKLRSFGYYFKYKTAARVTLVISITILVVVGLLVNADMFLVDEVLVIHHCFLFNLPIFNKFSILFRPSFPKSFRILGNTVVVIQIANILLYSILIVNVGMRFKALNIILKDQIDIQLKVIKVMSSNKYLSLFFSFTFT